MPRQRAICYALRVLKVFILALIILVNLECFLEANFFTFLYKFLAALAIIVNIVGALIFFFLQAISSQVIFYILLITLFMSRLIGLLATFVTLYNAVIFTYRFSGDIVIFFLKATVSNLYYFFYNLLKVIILK